VRRWLNITKKIFYYSCIASWFINMGLLVIGSMYDLYDLQILSIVNMMLLSFVLLKDTNEKTT
tara:strand:+ start:1112 stop:1300 length:189 start_codon:yes stop_codon:yes gene_type:complete